MTFGLGMVGSAVVLAGRSGMVSLVGRRGVGRVDRGGEWSVGWLLEEEMIDCAGDWSVVGCCDLRGLVGRWLLVVGRSPGIGR